MLLSDAVAVAAVVAVTVVVAVAVVVAVTAVVAVAVAMARIRAALRLERRLLHHHREAQSLHHVVEHMVVAVAQPQRPDLHRHMPVTEVISAAGEHIGVARMGRGHGLRRGGDLDDASIAGAQPVAAPQDAAARQYHADFHAVLEPCTESASAAHVER